MACTLLAALAIALAAFLAHGFLLGHLLAGFGSLVVFVVSVLCLVVSATYLSFGQGSGGTARFFLSADHFGTPLLSRTDLNPLDPSALSVSS